MPLPISLLPLPTTSPPSCQPTDPVMQPVDTRRRVVLRLAGGLLAGVPVLAAGSPRVPPRADSPPVGADPVVLQSGLAGRWATAMHRDMGWQARWLVHPSLAVLNLLEAGELPMGLFLSTPKADDLERAGLIHDRQTLARTDLLLVGPQDDLAGLRGTTDLVAALRQVLAAHAAGAADWTPPGPGDALAAWVAQWSVGLSRSVGSRAAAAAARPAQTPYRLVTRAAWGRGERDARIWLTGNREQAVALQVARAFRSRHPGAGLLVKWLQSPLAARQVRASAPAWQLAER